MSNTVPVIGIDPEELAWIRTLVWLLRHPDPVVPELARQALLYLEAAACARQQNDPGAGTANKALPASFAIPDRLILIERRS